MPKLPLPTELTGIFPTHRWDLVAWIIPKDVSSLGFLTLGIIRMPHKFNQARRHKFDKARYRVINWEEYDESLR